MNSNTRDYAIKGGKDGKTRLNLLADVLHQHTHDLLIRAGLTEGASFLDLGCGGGNVSRLAAGIVGKNGGVTAIDFDEEIIALNRQEDLHIANLSYRALSAYDLDYQRQFDIVYARFLLSHLKDPLVVLARMKQALKPGGRVVVEDIDFAGHFCYPQSNAFERYLDYYSQVIRSKGADANIGPKLLSLLTEAGLDDVGFDVVQPVFNKGEGKWMAWITLDRIKSSLVEHDIADQATIDKTLEELEAFTRNENTIISLPRVFRSWGTKN
jgi:ubiquinone/menaquinone biosynthesis C-methylase UbiE